MNATRLQRHELLLGVAPQVVQELLACSALEYFHDLAAIDIPTISNLIDGVGARVPGVIVDLHSHATGLAVGRLHDNTEYFSVCHLGTGIARQACDG